LPPFIVPVGIKAIYKEKLPPFEAELICDNMNAYSVEGRADVKDGWIIFDNDVTNKMTYTDNNEGMCSVRLISGDKSAAEFVAMQTLSDELNKIFLHKTQLSKEEKEKYHAEVLKDIENNRRKDTSTGGIYTAFLALGAPGILVSGLSMASDFHWHTNIQDVKDISKFKLRKHIKYSDDVHITTTRDIPPNLCLVYNTQSKAYDRCTEEELMQAKNMNTSIEEVMKSKECKDAQDPLECATNREEAGLPSREAKGKEPRDNHLVSNI
jgi:hypothetical protein